MTGFFFYSGWGGTYIHRERETDDSDIKLHKAIVLDAPVLDQSLLNGSDEIPVKDGVDNEVDNLLSSVPNFVDMNISVLWSAKGKHYNQFQS